MAEEKASTETEAPEASEAPPAENEAPPAEAPETELSLAELQGWKGFRLDDMGGASVGKVEGAYVDEQNGKPEWLLARMGRFGHHAWSRRATPSRPAATSGCRSRATRSARPPGSTRASRSSATTRSALLEHYGVGTGLVGRGADLAKRDAGAVTARPACR